MRPRDTVRYHRERATEELDRGIGAEAGCAARAHLQLASLHMLKLRELGAPADPPPVELLPARRAG